MNERIRELAVKAYKEAAALASQGVILMSQVREVQFEKFAELIVAECLVTLDSITSCDRDTLWVARKVIAKHFGVES